MHKALQAIYTFAVGFSAMMLMDSTKDGLVAAWMAVALMLGLAVSLSLDLRKR